MAVSRIPSKQLGFETATSTNNVVTEVDCEASVYVGAAVFMDSNVAKNAIATGEQRSKVIGFCYNKSSSTKCDIAVAGVTGEIFSGLDDSKLYFLSDTVEGAVVNTPIVNPGNYLILVGKPFSSDRLKIEIVPIALRG